ncbi:GntR family transcriptional regulator [Sodalis sp. RH21]|uniref:GntR family transcriptional regulator n=1 Tax=unclassified Sodalis (in: enterobacteria) TaxID=2636512 RepID=UPI0039B6CC19
MNTKKEALVSYLRNLIRQQNLTEGDRLLSESALARDLGVSRGTVREATRRLIDEGILYRVNGSGVFVGSGESFKQTHYHYLSSHAERAAQVGKQIHRKVLTLELIEQCSQRVSYKLEIAPASPVFHIRRLISFDEQPVTLENFYMPARLFPDLSPTALEQSKYEYVESRTGQRVAESRLTLEPILVSDEETTRLLGLEKLQPVLCQTEVGKLADGVAFEFNTSITNPKYLKITQIARRH